MAEAKLLAEQHRIGYNAHRAHSALEGRTSLERGVRSRKSSSNGMGPDQPNRSDKDWSSNGGHASQKLAKAASQFFCEPVLGFNQPLQLGQPRLGKQARKEAIDCDGTGRTSIPKGRSQAL